MEPTPPALEGGLLTTGPPGQSQQLQFRDGQFIVIHTIKGFGIVNKADKAETPMLWPPDAKN